MNLKNRVPAVLAAACVLGLGGQVAPAHAQGTVGTGNINLRGLGGLRTLVLFNGRRRGHLRVRCHCGRRQLHQPYRSRRP